MAGIYCADAGVILERLHWLRWTRKSAIATATVTVQGDPTGHGGGVYRARVTFWRPIRISGKLALFKCARFEPALPTEPATASVNLAYTAWPDGFGAHAGSADACDRR